MSYLLTAIMDANYVNSAYASFNAQTGGHMTNFGSAYGGFSPFFGIPQEGRYTISQPQFVQPVYVQATYAQPYYFQQPTIYYRYQ